MIQDVEIESTFTSGSGFQSRSCHIEFVNTLRCSPPALNTLLKVLHLKREEMKGYCEKAYETLQNESFEILTE